eukprot:CAMPEP_0206409312 /NCGR_PEP_ID=MMETSP0294-20121207/31766_1 /ASSEMBLY_ACC=CAM_ASM_000327 /TAXON_ID=39354 /ORGANISM="Heterosigma akashiwo, Strain CCMP2393" /LENGTH=50 /DNA_ID=CAMNT_0053869131 /DNA_START=42 /DNA_END=190 /DNA_ORIENTATION=-
MAWGQLGHCLANLLTQRDRAKALTMKKNRVHIQLLRIVGVEEAPTVVRSR